MATPPTMTGYSGRITDQPTITWTPDTVYEAAITAVEINDREVISDLYTLTTGQLLLDRDNFEIDGEYTVSITATGYDEATATVTLIVTPWSNIVLYDIDDLKAREKVILQNETDDQHFEVSNAIKVDLDTRFETENERGRGYLGGSDFTYLDYVRNPKVLKYLATTRALALLMEQRAFQDGIHKDKHQVYMTSYYKQLNTVAQRIQFGSTTDNANELPPNFRYLSNPSNSMGRIEFGR